MARVVFRRSTGLAVWLLVSVCFLGSWPALAEDKGVLGAGIIVGEPTGVSVKYYLGDDTAIAGAVGGAVVSKGLQVHADFLWHPWVLEAKSTFVLPAYIGAGVRILDRTSGDDEFRFGLRAVGGLLFDFTKVPLDVFIEVAGVADLRTRGSLFGLDVNLGAGVRYYF